jgi:hypothetical protein
MRTLIFRGLAGLIAVLCVLALVFGDLANQPLQQLVWMIVIPVIFGVYAVFGTEPAERLLVWVYGGEYPEKPAAGDEKPASRSESS